MDNASGNQRPGLMFDRTPSAGQSPRETVTLREIVSDGASLAGDLFRQVLTLVAVVGLVAIAAGAITGNHVYADTLDWISSLVTH